MKIYLAGKIYIIEEYPKKNDINGNYEWGGDLGYTPETYRYKLVNNNLYQDFEEKWPIIENIIFNEFDYVGPYFNQYKPHNNYDHGLDSGFENKKIFDNCLKAIESCDILFAWINENNAYGSFIEIGYAKGLDKIIIIGTKQKDYDKWFIYECANYFEENNDPILILRKGLIKLGYLSNPHTSNGKLTYFIKGGNYVKIGESTDPRSRLKNLQTANPNQLELLGVVNIPESEVQERFRKYHNQGEWYFYSKEIEDWIKEEKERDS